MFDYKVKRTEDNILIKVNNWINAAIVAITVGGQSYKIGSRQLTRADLKQLYNMKNDLTAQLAAERSGGLFDDCYVGVFDGR